MARTLLFVGDDRDVMADIALLPGRVVRCPSIGEARHYLLRDEEARNVDHLIAYGADVAARFSGGGLPGEEPLRAWGAPVVLLHGQYGSALRSAADHLSLNPVRIVSLPSGWGWLTRELAGTNEAAR